MVHDKVRIRFSKGGDLRFVSHHDLMRCFERILRRACLPFHSTGGFNPKPRLIFALSLPLGVVGCKEVAELELDDTIQPEEVIRRLAAEAPAGLQILSARRINKKDQAHVWLVRYRIPLLDEQEASVAGRINELLGSATCCVDRLRPQHRRIDLKPYLNNIRVCQGGLEMEVRVTPQGTARPHEILKLLGLDELVERGAIIERTDVLLEDEPVSDISTNKVLPDETDARL
jgi:radical SAM-linked protein